MLQTHKFYLDAGYDCNDTDIRLVNGSSIWEGLVELCFDGLWGAVCAGGVDKHAASVICRGLGLPNAGATFLSCRLHARIAKGPS